MFMFLQEATGLSPQEVQEVQDFELRYNNSSYFHVGPRRRCAAFVRQSARNLEGRNPSDAALIEMWQGATDFTHMYIRANISVRMKNAKPGVI